MADRWYDLSLEVLGDDGQVRDIHFVGATFAQALRWTMAAWDEQPGRIITIHLEEVLSLQRCRELNTGSGVKPDPAANDG